MNDLGKLLKELRGKNSLRTISARTFDKISFAYLDTLEKGINPSNGHPIKPAPEKLKILSEVYSYPYKELLRLAGYLDEDEDEDEDNPIENKKIEPKIEIKVNKIEELYNNFLTLSQKERLDFLNLIMK